MDITTLDRLVSSIQRSSRLYGSRGLLLLSSDRTVRDTGLARWAQRRSFKTLAAPTRTRPDASDRLLAVLGHENGDLFWSAPADVRASEVAALLGTVTAGSLVIVRLPATALRRSRLLRRLWYAAGHPQGSTMARTASAALSLGPRFERDAARRRAVANTGTSTMHIQATVRSANETTAIDAQDAMLQYALDTLRGSIDACIVILGHRGSGKSRLLGRIAAALSSACGAGGPLDPVRIVSATGKLADSLLVACPNVRRTTVQGALTGRGFTLVLDESASLPLATLAALANRHERIVFASTVNGYEATGRAFASRFLADLDSLRPGWRRIDTIGHFRFRADDPVNRLLETAFLLDVEIGRQIDVDSCQVDPWTIDAPGPIALRQREHLLRQIVSLLANHHYRDALDDLDAMLDGRLMTVVARAGDRVIGVAMAAHEGRLPTALGEPILAGRRRLPDQLLAQRLARCANDASALGERYLRVTRIAVVPERRREGIASQLIRHLSQASGSNVAIGASFAQGDGANRFWASLGARAFHDGVRVNPRSGERSRAVLFGGTARTCKVLDQAIAIHRDNECPSPVSADPSRDAALLHRFMAGQRRWRDCRAVLTRAWKLTAPDGAPELEQSRTFLALPGDAGERRWERALIDWFACHGSGSSAAANER